MFLNKNFFLKITSFVVVILFWEYAGRINYSSALPSFTETMAALFEMIMDGSLGTAFAKTLYPLAIGLLASIFVGVSLGMFMGLKEGGEWLFAPIFIVAQAAPLAALIPILTFAYGIGITAKIFTVCIMAMPVIVLNTLGAVRNTPGSLVEMAKSFQATRFQVVMNIILPAASPLIFVGLRLGCASGFIGIILAELLITPTGIGDIISYNQSVAEYGKMYAAILSIIVSSVFFIEMLEKTEKLMFSPEKRI
ncbi:ABC transporter permease subunit [Polaromonas sp. YR568]|uniref:ABC transporter permease n=1 Tax=Polaromonas sp. YR568 TaxID=1855301 RepID=UPI00313776ED